MSYSREKAFQCYECDKRFHQQSQLVVHIRHHTGEKPFVCNYCSKGFASLKVLKVHERVHTGERPYKCPYCDKSFSAYANLVVHRRIHTNEKPYVCKLCSRGFEHSGNLSRHFRAHMVDTGFRCILCGKIFELEQDLLDHTKSDHPNEYETYLSSDKSRQQDKIAPKEPHAVDLSESEALNTEVSEENSIININDMNATKERLITKINKKEMKIIHSNFSLNSRSSLSPKENSLSFTKNNLQEESYPFSIESDCNLSPLTDTSNISDNSERSWKSETEELERSGNTYTRNTSHSIPKKQMHIKKRKELHITYLSENNHYHSYNSHLDGSPPSNDYISDPSHDSPDQFALTRSPNSPSHDRASSFCSSSGHTYEDSSNHEEDFQIMENRRQTPSQDPYHNNNNNNYNSSRSNSKNYFLAPPPLIPIEDIDHSTELPTLEPFHQMDSEHCESSLSSIMQDCDLYSDPVKSEFEDQYQRKPKLEMKPDANNISNVKEIIQKSIRQFVTPEIQKEMFQRKVERALCTLVGKNVMEHFGYPERTCEQVLICILDMAKRSPCADVRVNEIDRMKINMRKLIECSFPNKVSWDRLGWKGKPIEFILDNIQGHDDSDISAGSADGVDYGASGNTFGNSASFAPINFAGEDSKLDIKSEVASLFKRELK